MRTACRCLGFADWNDTINLPTGAESLFTAQFVRRGAARVHCTARSHIGDSPPDECYRGIR
ncbi:MAG: hypothetical protein M0C28_19465 [Candidatus Moduliflexus flocculans]|nr:hypothetical protein [Candidatus Moduliflexus flocculans]